MRWGELVVGEGEEGGREGERVREVGRGGKGGREEGEVGGTYQ